MFIAYSSETKHTYYNVNTSGNACPTCGAQDLILHKETTTWKLFWIIPIFWFSTYTLLCPVCKKAKHVSSSEGKALVILSEHQNRNQPTPQEEQLFDEFTPPTQPSSPLQDIETVNQSETLQKTEETDESVKNEELDEPLPASAGSLGGKIYHLRRSLYMSQEQFGEKIGVSRQAVCKWELDKAQPDEKNLAQMMHVFSLPPDYFTEKTTKQKISEQKIADESETEEKRTLNATMPLPYPENTANVNTYVHFTKTPQEKKNPLLLGLAITFGAALLIFNIVITAIHMPGYIQFPIFWFYIGSFIAANAMLIPVAICAMAKRKISASIVSFISYILVAVFTLWGTIPSYEKPETRTIHSNETFTQSMYIPIFPQGVTSDGFWSSEGNTFIFEFVNCYHVSLRFTWEQAEGRYRVENTYVTLYGINYDGEEEMLETGYLMANHWFAYDFTLNFNTYPSYKMTYSHEGLAYFKLTWEQDKEATSTE